MATCQAGGHIFVRVDAQDSYKVMDKGKHGQRLD